MMDDLPGIARPAAAVFSSLSAMAAGVIIHRALRPTPARMELHPLRQYWLEPRAINIAPLATSTVLFYRTIIIGRSDGMRYGTIRLLTIKRQMDTELALQLALEKQNLAMPNQEKELIKCQK